MAHFIVLIILLFGCGSTIPSTASTPVKTNIPEDNARVDVIHRHTVYTSSAPLPIGPYSQAILVDKTLYISGQIGLTSSGQLVDGIEAQTSQALDNIRNILADLDSTFFNLVKTSIMLSNISDYAVVNQIYSEYFDTYVPARSVIEVPKLPRNALIEIEAVAVIGIIMDE